jgi:hypothetical protein
VRAREHVHHFERLDFRSAARGAHPGDSKGVLL